MKKPAFKGQLKGTIGQVAQQLRDLKNAASPAVLRLALSPLLLLAFVLTGEEHPSRPKGSRHLLENYF